VHTSLLPTDFKHRLRKIVLRSPDPRLSISHFRSKFSELLDGSPPATTTPPQCIAAQTKTLPPTTPNPH
jgi:hypothetical protein